MEFILKEISTTYHDEGAMLRSLDLQNVLHSARDILLGTCILALAFHLISWLRDEWNQALLRIRLGLTVG